MHLTVAVIAVLLSVCVGIPQQGYNYEQPRPQTPPSLYETPTRRTPRPPPPPPPQRPSNSYGAPTNTGPVKVDPPRPRPPSGPKAAPMEGMPYDFDWAVEDPESGNSFVHVERSDGQRTEGEYRVLLPDGRTQVVVFFDDGNGFNAEVKYT